VISRCSSAICEYVEESGTRKAEGDVSWLPPSGYVRKSAVHTEVLLSSDRAATLEGAADSALAIGTDSGTGKSLISPSRGEALLRNA
jgi:hypothetical protein